MPLSLLSPSRSPIRWLALALLLTACSGGEATPAAPEDTVAPPSVSPSPEPAAASPTVEPSATATLPPAGCAETHGHIEITQMTTSLVPAPVEVRVYFPPCYSPDPAAPYPVLVMIHGQTYTADQWDRLGLDEAADAAIVAGQSRPFLIFMPLEEDTERDPDDSNFDVVVTDALLPWIDANYPTCTERACRAVGGLSRGATWAAHIGFLRPEVFGSIGAHSLTPFFGDVYRLPYWLMRTTVAELPRFYLDMGEDDWFMDPLAQFRAAMTEDGVVFEWHLDAGSHDEAYWSGHVADYVAWYASGWPALP
jgi:enterochelin esterase-like enzyme